jgi:hypothetical protein
MIKKGITNGVTTSKSITVDEFGIVTQTITTTLSGDFTGGNSYRSQDFMIIGANSPDFNQLLCTDVSIDDSDAIKTITKTFKGAIERQESYRLSAQGTQEPIQTHPAFDDEPDGYNGKIAGNGADAKNGAKFKGEEEDSEFDYFPANADNDLGGVTGYLSPSLELEKITVETNDRMDQPTWITDDIYDIADIKDPDAQLSVGDRNWLLMGSTQEVIGGAIKSTAIYRLSGEKGWNTKIYTSA